MKKNQIICRKLRNRRKIISKSNRNFRLVVFRSNKHIYAQVIDNSSGNVLACASSTEEKFKELYSKGSDVKAAKIIGEMISEKAIKAQVVEVVFDRGPYKYQGKIAALADAARQKGLVF